jgi:hypothetical protein
MHSAVMTPANEMIVYGGYDNGQLVGDIVVYSTNTAVWRTLGSTTHTRYGHAASLFVKRQEYDDIMF